MSLFWYCLIAVVLVFAAGVLAGMLLAVMHREEADRDGEELLPIEIGEVVDDAEQ